MYKTSKKVISKEHPEYNNKKQTQNPMKLFLNQNKYLDSSYKYPDTPLYLIPENYIGSCKKNSGILQTTAITSCMAIALIGEKRVALAHIANMTGYPTRTLEENLHPIPENELNKSFIQNMKDQYIGRKEKVEKICLMGFYTSNAYAKLFDKSTLSNLNPLDCTSYLQDIFPEAQIVKMGGASTYSLVSERFFDSESYEEWAEKTAPTSKYSFES